ncbi:MAG: MBL fold metallo-hydrolase [Gemmatimonadaceae bacterium]
MLLKRFYHEGLAQASYLLGCQKTGEAIVVDPNRDPEPYLADARENGMRITQVTETHIHADFLSGSRELAARAGGQLLLSAEGGPEWQYSFATGDGARLLRDGDEIRVGKLRLDVMHTPGHTPEHLVFIITDLPASDLPLGVLSGDFLFVGDVGRPDLLERAVHVAGTMRGAAGTLFDSVRRFVARYPDYLQIWPGHGSGSACGKSLGAAPMSTLGYERVANWALRTTHRDTFIDEVLAGQPDPPRYFATMKRLNREGPRVLGAMPAARRLPPTALAAVLEAGHRIVDIRPAKVAAQDLVRGTVNIPLNKSFPGWAGWLIPYDQDFFLLHDDHNDLTIRHALSELSMVGLDRCVGWFGSDTVAAARAAGNVDQVAQAEPAQTAALLSAEAVTVLDVRNHDEWNAGHVEGAVHIPLGRLEERLGEVDTSRPVVLHCQGGGRSSIAASLLKAQGLRNVSNLRGGYAAWTLAELPVVQGDAQVTHG